MDVESAVRTFMVAVDQIGEYDKATEELRLTLIDEEYYELIEALNWGDPVHIAKEACDLVYVVVGTLVAMGIPFNDCFAALQQSNLSKLGADGKAIRRDDGKVLKGPDFKPAEDAIKVILAQK